MRGDVLGMGARRSRLMQMQKTQIRVIFQLDQEGTKLNQERVSLYRHSNFIGNYV